MRRTFSGAWLVVALVWGCDGGAADDAGVPPDDAAAPADGGGDTVPRAMTASGPVEGITQNGAHTFFGIPYAAPPVGDRRFRPPEAPDAWTEPLDARAPRSHCPQPSNALLVPRGEASEGCLELDVFTPDLTPAEPLPVMVFIHGGAFVIGSGNVAVWDGARLASQGAVVITVSYRLGLAGFLAHPALDAEADGASGMYGILDQQAALRWVRDNAAAFGGDPGNVTIFGESAGALSVCVHYFAPGSAGLFHRAISESGSCLDGPRWLIGVPDHAPSVARGVDVATALGCPGEDAAAAACLRALSIDQLVEAQRSLGLPDPDPAYRMLAIGPNVDGEVLPDRPSTLLAAGRHAGVPYIIGTNADEGTFFSDDALAATAADYEAQIRQLFGDEADAVLAAYPAAGFDTPLAAYDAALRDLAFVCPTRALLTGLTESGVVARTYELRTTNAPIAAMGWGAAHAVDLLYVFGNFDLPFARPDASERVVLAAMQGYWTRFAATGDPNGAGAVEWPRYDATEPVLVLDDPVTASAGLDQARCAAITP
ncbi:MAG: carboxylesterase family protein [Myxococcales bacterium]|nr:carboxylesterase family protein [Myxococcales bacterium]